MVERCFKVTYVPKTQGPYWIYALEAMFHLGSPKEVPEDVEGSKPSILAILSPFEASRGPQIEI